jgi:hypothetical protein
MRINATLAEIAFAAVTAAVLTAPGAHADVDTDFANQLHTYGIYGQRDYNAWIGKITCERLATHLDADAFKSSAFLKGNLARTSSTEQVWQFLGAAVQTYCPEQTPALRSAAESSSHTTKEHR